MSVSSIAARSRAISVIMHLMHLEVSSIYLRRHIMSVKKQVDSLMPPDVQEMVVDGKATMTVEPSEKTETRCPVCGFIRRKWDIPPDFRLHFSDWDGSDIFLSTPPLAHSIMVTERARNVLLNSALTGYEISTPEAVLDRIRTPIIVPPVHPSVRQNVLPV